MKSLLLVLALLCTSTLVSADTRVLQIGQPPINVSIGDYVRFGDSQVLSHSMFCTACPTSTTYEWIAEFWGDDNPCEALVELDEDYFSCTPAPEGGSTWQVTSVSFWCITIARCDD